ncbi:MAG TPA: heat-inducible transcriptional repressor HrcA [Microthrixaceae bacterium]|nr:heat-inducible transcriptional repressor HrcA [Microthrixaceae bacterium]
MLDDRKSAILRALVERYIETAQPVGSSQIVASSEVGVSSATVRNEMTVLESEGYIVQPHTSAGRIPTEKGYRFFVDNLTGPGELGPSQVRQVRSFFSHAHGELEEMLKSTSRLLSQLTATTAVVVGETGEHAIVRSVQLVGLGTRTVLAVVVMSDGVVLKRVVESPEDLDDERLARATERVAGAVLGYGLHDPQPAAPTGDRSTDALVDLALDAVRHAGEESKRVYVEGASRIADAFDATIQLREILGLLEQQITVVSLLEDVLGRGLTVAIGSETGVAPLANCAVVVAPFAIGGEHAGAIGVLGPARMNYPEALAAVSAVSQRLGRMLTEG